MASGFPYFYSLCIFDAETKIESRRNNYKKELDGTPVPVVPGWAADPSWTEKVRVVPNPYSSTGKTFVGEPDKIIFKNIPGVCTIRIYTSAGDLVKVIEHTDGSGDQAWDLRTDYNQYLKSDLYVFTVESKDPNVSGNYVGKFIVVR